MVIAGEGRTRGFSKRRPSSHEAVLRWQVVDGGITGEAD